MSDDYFDEEEDIRTWKALPLLKALAVAILIPVIFVFVFTLAGAATNPLLMQIEIVLVAIGFCLVGILTRSKSRGFLNIIAAPISWGILYLADTLTGGWIANPYGLISGLAEPLSAIAASPLGAQLASAMGVLSQIAIIVDLLIVEILAFFLGFFLSMLATGIWKKTGKFSIISVPFKLIAAAFSILILFIVPFAYHGIGNLADGGVSIGAGAMEFLGALGSTDGGGGGAQAGDLDLGNPEVLAELMAAAQRAEKWFRRSSLSFKQAQENFLIRAVLNAIFSGGSSFEGLNMRNITSILSISTILADISSELPALLAGYQNFANGFNTTFSILGQTSIGGGFGGSANSLFAAYDPTFIVGLDDLSAALDNFTDAQDGVLRAIGQAQSIIKDVVVDEAGQFGFMVDLIDETSAFFPVLLNISRGGIFFLNGTYKTALSIEDLGNSDFSGANFWLNTAAEDLDRANTTLQDVDMSALNKDSVLPFYGTAKIIKDLVNLLGWFTRAAANTTDCYIQINATLNALQELDFSGTDVLSTDWNSLSSSIAAANIKFDAATYNIGKATNLSTDLANESYGPVIDATLGSAIVDFGSMMSQFTSNITEVEFLLDALESTVFSIQSFTEGFELFNNSYNTAYTAASGDSATFFSLFNLDPDINRSKDLMGFCQTNASTGYSDVAKTSVISADVRTTWQGILYFPPPTAIPTSDGGSIAGLAQGILEAIGIIELASQLSQAEGNAALIQLFFEDMDAMDLTGIFSSNGP